MSLISKYIRYDWSELDITGHKLVSMNTEVETEKVEVHTDIFSYT